MAHSSCVLAKKGSPFSSVMSVNEYSTSTEVLSLVCKSQAKHSDTNEYEISYLQCQRFDSQAESIECGILLLGDSIYVSHCVDSDDTGKGGGGGGGG